MLRIRTLVFALLLAAVLVPALAQAQPPIVLPRLITTVTVVGAGETEDEAVENAIRHLEEDYRVLSYTVGYSFCTEEDPVGPIGPFTLCAAEVEARVIRKILVGRP